MNAEHATQLRMIGESAADFAAANGGSARARRVHEGAPAWDGAGWQAIADMGWLGIAVPESRGGLALGAAAVAVVAEQAGRALMTAPLTMGIAAASLLAACDGSGGNDAADSTLTQLIAGQAHLALATASPAPNGDWRAAVVPDGDAASQWLIGSGRGDGFSARALRFDGPGIARSARTAVDGSVLADVAIDAAAWADAPRWLSGSTGEAAWQRATNLLRLGDAAYLCGLMDAALQLALDYLRLRRQFGVPIGSFQALQHRATDCHVDVTATRALVYEAARAFGTAGEHWAASASVQRASAAALRVTQAVVQFHGAIGFADEHDAGLYLRRAMTVGARHAETALADLLAQARPD